MSSLLLPTLQAHGRPCSASNSKPELCRSGPAPLWARRRAPEPSRLQVPDFSSSALPPASEVHIGQEKSRSIVSEDSEDHSSPESPDTWLGDSPNSTATSPSDGRQPSPVSPQQPNGDYSIPTIPFQPTSSSPVYLTTVSILPTNSLGLIVDTSFSSPCSPSSPSSTICVPPSSARTWDLDDDDDDACSSLIDRPRRSVPPRSMIPAIQRAREANMEGIACRLSPRA